MLFVILEIIVNQHLYSIDEITCYIFGNMYSFVISQFSTYRSTIVSGELLLGFELSSVYSSIYCFLCSLSNTDALLFVMVILVT